MSAVPPNTAPSHEASERALTTACQQITVGAADVALSAIFACGFCRRIVAQASGTVFVQRSIDTAPLSYVLAAGGSVEGNIVLIGGTTNHPTASAIALNLEV